MTFEEIRAIAEKCFGCGQDNKVGLKLKFHEVEKGVVQVKTILPARYQGYDGIAHGGIVCTLLDEAMAYATLHFSKPGQVFTARMEVQFLKPVPIEKEINLIGCVVTVKRNIFETEAEIRSIDGDILASATGKYLWTKTGKDN